MRDLGVDLPDRVGFTASASRESLFHKIRQDGGEGAGGDHGACGAVLEDIRPSSEIRRYERPCRLCWRGTPTTSLAKRRTAWVRPPIVTPVSPVGPLDLRVTDDGLLGIRSGPDEWIVFDPANPLMLGRADDAAADGWRTLRSTWPAETLINAIEIADRFGVDRAAVANWRKRDPLFPQVSAFVGDRPGWHRELMPEIDRWHTNNRNPRGGGSTRES